MDTDERLKEEENYMRGTYPAFGPVGGNLRQWEGVIITPKRRYKVRITLPKNYPNEPPSVSYPDSNLNIMPKKIMGWSPKYFFGDVIEEIEQEIKKRGSASRSGGRTPSSPRPDEKDINERLAKEAVLIRKNHPNFGSVNNNLKIWEGLIVTRRGRHKVKIHIPDDFPNSPPTVSNDLNVVPKMLSSWSPSYSISDVIREVGREIRKKEKQREGMGTVERTVDQGVSEIGGIGGSINTKKCPFCAEEVQFDAVKCKHCGEWLDRKSVDAQSVDDWISKAEKHKELGQWDEAAKCYGKAIEIGPDNADLWIEKGDMMMALEGCSYTQDSPVRWTIKGVEGKIYPNTILKKAVKCFDKAIYIEPNNATAWNYKGMALFVMGDYHAAISCFDKVAETDPRQGLPNKASVLGIVNNYEGEIECWDRLIEMSSGEEKEHYMGMKKNAQAKKSKCFIATAAYGTPFAEEINILRYWRDTFLLKHLLGRLFVKTYYKTSPPIADFISKRNRIKFFVRAILNPYVEFLKYIYRK